MRCGIFRGVRALRESDSLEQVDTKLEESPLGREVSIDADEYK